jgi:hypothetical protein
MGSNKQGQWAVMIYTMFKVLNLILDQPPQDLLNNWERTRAKLYRKVEPKAPLRDERPIYPRNAKLTTVQFTGEASDRVWQILLADLDQDKHQELEQEAQALFGGDLSMVTQVEAGTRYHTIGDTEQGRKAIQKCMINTPTGPQLDPAKITLEGPKRAWLKELGPDDPVQTSAPLTQVVESVAAAAGFIVPCPPPPPPYAPSSSSSADLGTPAGPGPDDIIQVPRSGPGSAGTTAPKCKSKSASVLAEQITDLQAALKVKTPSRSAD